MNDHYCSSVAGNTSNVAANEGSPAEGASARLESKLC